MLYILGSGYVIGCFIMLYRVVSAGVLRRVVTNYGLSAMIGAIIFILFLWPSWSIWWLKQKWQHCKEDNDMKGVE